MGLGFLPSVSGFCVMSKRRGTLGPVNISIQQADLQPQFGKSQRQIDGDGGFADAVFAAGHRAMIADTPGTPRVVV